MTFAPLPPKGKLSFTTDLKVMAQRADFIQENIPEQLPLKQRMLAEVSRHAAADVIIASSTSGLTPDRPAARHGRSRALPASLIRSIRSICCRWSNSWAAIRPSPATIEAAAEFFTYIGMHALRVRREVPGHLTDRLQEAIWREILHMVNDGVATTGELDESIIYGPGLRWAAMGTNLIYHLAGGETGMRHMLAQFGPALKWPWTKLEAPELTEELIDRMVEGDPGAGGRAVRSGSSSGCETIISWRFNRFCASSISAPARLCARSRRGFTRMPRAPMRPRPSPLRRGCRCPDSIRWSGPSGWTTTAICRTFFMGTYSARPWMRCTGASGSTRRIATSGRMFYTVESHVRHLGEAKVSEPLYVTTQLLALDEKRLHMFHRLYRGRDDVLIATGEQMHLHVDTAASKATPMDRGTALEARGDASGARRALPVPEEAGKPVGSRAGR